VASIEKVRDKLRVLPALSVAMTLNPYSPSGNPLTEWEVFAPEHGEKLPAWPDATTLQRTLATPEVASCAENVHDSVSVGPKVSPLGPSTLSVGAVWSTVIVRAGVCVELPAAS
jgi:hypothetical protein